MRHAFAIALLVWLPGCAMMTREVRLPDPALVARRGPALCVKVERLADVRPHPQKVGLVRNGFYASTADAITKDDVAGWLTKALQNELSRGAQDCTAPALTVTGTVNDAFADEYWNLDAKISVTLKMSRAGKQLMDATFQGRALKVSMAGSSSEFEEILLAALSDLLSTVGTAAANAAAAN